MKSLLVAFCLALFTAAAPQGDGVGDVAVAPAPACPTILPAGTSCMPNETCIRRGGECAITQPVAPIKCKCVI